MVDTQRFNLGPGCVRVVTDVARALAKKHKCTSVLAVASYLPLDVDSVARVLEAQLELDEVTAETGEDDIQYFYFSDDIDPIDLDDHTLFEENVPFQKNLTSLRNDEDWTGKVRVHHELLRVGAKAASRTVDFDYLIEKTSLTRPKLQSILNDFGSQGHIRIDVPDDGEAIQYTFPKFGYPAVRFDHHQDVMDELESKPAGRGARIALAIAALVLFIVLASRLF